MIRKNITIEERHDDWIGENSINLSRFVQKCIDDKIEFDKNRKE